MIFPRLMAVLTGLGTVAYLAAMWHWGLIDPTIFGPLVIMALVLCAFGFRSAGPHARRWQLTGAWFAYSGAVISTIVALYFLKATAIMGQSLALLLLLGGLMTLRCLYLSTRRRRSSIRNYYDR